MDPLTFLHLDRDGEQPLARQLAEQIRAAISRGQLRAGERVPSTRKLAETLAVSRTVVVAAYEQLLGEAFLEGVPGSGTRVPAELPTWRTDPPRPQRAPKPIVGSGIPDARQGRARDLIDLAPGYPYVSPEPPREWLRALSAAAHEAWSAPAPPAQGTAALREQLAAHVRFFRGVACAAEDIVLTSGTSEALLLTSLALGRVLGSAHRIAIEDPGYPEGRHALELGGAECLAAPVGTNGMSLAALQAADRGQPISAVMLTPSHQYPLGGRLPANERFALLEWAHATGAVLIEDDYDSEFRHTGPALPAMASLDARGVTVYVASLNKTFHPSLRCGFMVLPTGNAALRAEVLAARDAVGTSVSAHTQLALARFIAAGGLKRAVARNRREYQHRRSLLLGHFAARGIPVEGADGGLHVVLRLPDAIDARAVAGELRIQEARGVHVEAIADFAVPVVAGAGAGATAGSAAPSREHEAANGLIIGYGQESVPRLIEGLTRITETLKGRGYPATA